MRLIRYLFLAALVCGLGAGCRKRTGDDRIVLRVGDHVVTAGEFRRLMEERGGHVPQVFDRKENRLALAEERIRSEVLARQAAREGLLQDPEIQERLRQMLADRLEQRLLDKAGGDWKPTSNELEQAYAARATNRYAIPAAVRPAVLFIAAPAGITPDARAVRRQRAEQARLEALALAPGTPHFGAVAAKYSDDQATRYIGGDCGWVNPERKDFRFQDLAPRLQEPLEPSQVGEVIETGKGFYLLKLMERREASALPFERVKANLERELAMERRKAILDKAYAEARRGLRVTLDEAVLESLPTPLPPEAEAPTNPDDP